VDAVLLKDRTGRTERISKAAVVLGGPAGDGNQALIDPMDIDASGACSTPWCRWVQEVEVGSRRRATGLRFIPQLIEDDLIPQDVTIQVLVQCAGS